MTFKRSALLVGALTMVLANCAKISAPTGGEPDRDPPRVIATEPAQMSVLSGWDGPVVFQFDERISERRIEESVMVSPETGAVKIKKGRSDLRVSLEGGWRPGQVYRVVILPVVQDLFSNTIKHEIELIFSTGPEIPATAVAGILTDRITGEVVGGARVEAISQQDSIRYVALSDTAGFFALRHIPAGSYLLQSYLDRNRNRKLDFGEPMDTITVSPAPTDTIILSRTLLPADTTPARVVRAEARDSLQVRVTLDDYLDPERPLAGMVVGLRSLPDSLSIPVGRVVHLHEFERERALEEARRDSIRAAELAAAADTAGADEVRPVPKPPALAGTTGTPHGPGPDSTKVPEDPLPAREVVVVPESPLAPGTRYWIELSGITNINGVGGGAGSVEFETPKAPEPEVDENPPDTPAEPTGDEPPVPGEPDAPVKSDPDTTRTDSVSPAPANPDTVPAPVGQDTIIPQLPADPSDSVPARPQPEGRLEEDDG